jgi:hypothetical protein
MKLTANKLAFLSAWPREEWQPACYSLPAHRLQLSHGVTGAQLFLLIKAGVDGEGMKYQDILNIEASPDPRWPWPLQNEFESRLDEASHQLT